MQPIGEVSSSNHARFMVHSGISTSLIPQLVAFSTSDDPHLKAFTQDARRFESVSEVEKWM